MGVCAGVVADLFFVDFCCLVWLCILLLEYCVCLIKLFACLAVSVLTWCDWFVLRLLLICIWLLFTRLSLFGFIVCFVGLAFVAWH